MKKFIYIALGLSAAACTQLPQNRTIDSPEVTATNTSKLQIFKVEMTDSSTTLSCRLESRPGWWVRIDSGSYIDADGVKYPVSSADGIVIGEQHTIPESGVDTVKLIFPAIPAQTKLIDFSEGVADGWAVYGIDVTGNGLSDEIKLPEVKGEVCIEPTLEAAPTTLNFHILGYRPGYGDKLNVSISDSYFNTQGPLSISVDSLGNATMDVVLYGNSTVRATPSGLNTPARSVIVAPGVTTDISIDPRYTVDAINGAKGILRIADNGKYAALNAAKNTIDVNTGFDLYDSDDFYKVGPEEYTKGVLDYAAKAYASIDSMAVSDEIKDYFKAYVNTQAILNMTNKTGNQANVLFRKHGVYIENYKDSIGAPLRDEDYASLNIDIDNPTLRLFPTFAYVTNTDIENFGNYPKAEEMKTFIGKYSAARKGKLTDADLDTLKALSEPFYAKAAELCQAETVKKKNDVSKIINPTPSVANDKLFEAIVASYKGKVVLVDLWNTWCGPCRRALAANEPLKTGELADDDIVWVYIADTSSNMSQYAAMIKDIKGEHYLVNDEQIAAIRKQFDVDGIPYYILVDRNGKATGHPDYRDHDKLIEGIKSAL